MNFLPTSATRPSNSALSWNMTHKTHDQEQAFDTEELGHWYLRLNGFLTIRNFVVHRDAAPGQETDADILGIRFPNREEVVDDKPLADEPFFTAERKPLIVIAEVKGRNRRCKLNGPWTNPDRKNVNKVIKAIGAFPPDLVDDVSTSLYSFKKFNGETWTVALICFGGRRNSSLHSNVHQILWEEVARFIYRRYQEHRAGKSRHDQWPRIGNRLWSISQNCDENTFVEQVVAQLRTISR